MTKEEIKRVLPVSDVLLFYEFAKSRYKDLWHCKIHGDEYASLVANDRRGIATCLSQRCLDGADVFSIIMTIEGCNFPEAMKKAILISRSEIAAVIQKTKYSSPKKKERKRTNPDIIPNTHNLESRHINWLITHFRKEWQWLVERFQILAYYPHIAVPISKDSMVFLPINPYDKKFNPEGDRIYHRGKNRIPQVFPDWPERHRKVQNIFVCEGEKDVMRVETQLFRNGKIDSWVAITNTMGAQSLSEEIDLFKNFDPEKVEKVIICYDHDPAGERANKIAYQIAKNYFSKKTSIKIFRFPKQLPHGYDISDYLNQKYSE